MTAPGDPVVAKRLLAAWFQERDYLKFAERRQLRVGRFATAEAVRPTGLLVPTLAGRWGSMTAAGQWGLLAQGMPD